MIVKSWFFWKEGTGGFGPRAWRPPRWESGCRNCRPERSSSAKVSVVLGPPLPGRRSGSRKWLSGQIKSNYANYLDIVGTFGRSSRNHCVKLSCEELFRQEDEKILFLFSGANWTDKRISISWYSKQRLVVTGFCNLVETAPGTRASRPVSGECNPRLGNRGSSSSQPRVKDGKPFCQEVKGGLLDGHS